MAKFLCKYSLLFRPTKQSVRILLSLKITAEKGKKSMYNSGCDKMEGIILDYILINNFLFNDKKEKMQAKYKYLAKAPNVFIVFYSSFYLASPICPLFLALTVKKNYYSLNSIISCHCYVLGFYYYYFYIVLFFFALLFSGRPS